MSLPTDARPYPKEAQLARGERRYRRIVASPRQWQALRAEKDCPCRSCGQQPPNELHHLVSRAALGDDAADNLVPLCPACHDAITCRRDGAAELLTAALTEAEHAYVETKRR